MSVVSTAIIAGAAAGLTVAADDVVRSLYQALKAIVARALSISFDEIESDPNSEAAQRSIEKRLESSGLEENQEILQLSKAILERLDAINADLPRSVLIKVGRLAAKGDIFFRNISLPEGQALLDADTVRSSGSIVFSDIGASSHKSGPQSIVIGSAFAQSIIFSIGAFARKFAELPAYAKSIVSAIIILLVAILLYIILWRGEGNAQARENFDATFERSMAGMRSEYMSSSNILTSVLPANIIRTSSLSHWRSFSESWNTHTNRMNQLFQPLAECLSNGSCAPGSQRDEVCRIVDTQISAYDNIHQRLQGGLGINLDYTGGGAFGDAFGPNVRVPRIGVIQEVKRASC
jgi:hypothetical protein